MARYFFLSCAVVAAAVFAVSFVWSPVLWTLVLLGPLFLLGLRDFAQREHAVLRNFPLIGHGRYLLELIRPEIHQYFIESNSDGKPFGRDIRSLVYSRAKNELETLPFGTILDVYEPGYEWINHSLEAHRAEHHDPRVRIGAETCAKPYDASVLNISAMSFGSLSASAIRALNRGAKAGGFYHNTGEGAVSRHHAEPGGDLVWQVGTGYFGCRSSSGEFDPGAFADRAALDSVRMIEVKLSQGAKPGHGGILPAAKITPEIAEIRGVTPGRDVLSPPTHTAFRGPRGLLEFVARLRELSGGKPVGFKLCVGSPEEFLGICAAMRDEDLLPDFISVDGAEGGTGAAPLEFSDSIGMPLTEGLILVHSALVGFGLRDRIKIIAAGKIASGFDMAKRLAIGADLCASARAFMFALGCIQARRCNTNHCPVGVATQDAGLERGLVVPDKAERVREYHASTVEALVEILGAAGLDRPEDLRPWHLHRRISETEVQSYDEIHDFLDEPVLLQPPYPGRWAEWMKRASAERFRHVPAPGDAINVRSGR